MQGCFLPAPSFFIAINNVCECVHGLIVIEDKKSYTGNDHDDFITKKVEPFPFVFIITAAVA